MAQRLQLFLCPGSWVRCTSVALPAWPVLCRLPGKRGQEERGKKRDCPGVRPCPSSFLPPNLHCLCPSRLSPPGKTPQSCWIIHPSLLSQSVECGPAACWAHWEEVAVFDLHLQVRFGFCIPILWLSRQILAGERWLNPWVLPSVLSITRFHERCWAPLFSWWKQRRLVKEVRHPQI